MSKPHSPYNSPTLMGHDSGIPEDVVKEGCALTCGLIVGEVILIGSAIGMSGMGLLWLIPATLAVILFIGIWSID